MTTSLFLSAPKHSQSCRGFYTVALMYNQRDGLHNLLNNSEYRMSILQAFSIDNLMQIAFHNSPLASCLKHTKKGEELVSISQSSNIADGWTPTIQKQHLHLWQGRQDMLENASLLYKGLCLHARESHVYFTAEYTNREASKEDADEDSMRFKYNLKTCKQSAFKWYQALLEKASLL